MTPAKLEITILNIVTYASLEVLSFIVLHFALRQKLDVSPACVLSFVLETNFVEFLGRLVAWYVSLLVFTLDHCGRYTVSLFACCLELYKLCLIAQQISTLRFSFHGCTRNILSKSCFSIGKYSENEIKTELPSCGLIKRSQKAENGVSPLYQHGTQPILDKRSVARSRLLDTFSVN